MSTFFMSIDVIFVIIKIMCIYQCIDLPNWKVKVIGKVKGILTSSYFLGNLKVSNFTVTSYAKIKVTLTLINFLNCIFVRLQFVYYKYTHKENRHWKLFLITKNNLTNMK